MGVVVEGATVLIRNATVERHFPGGVLEYERQCPNRTFCSDGQLCRVGFMAEDDATAYIESLAEIGFSRPTSQDSPDIALVNQAAGLVHPCDWLDVNQVDFGSGETALVASLRGATSSKVVAPSGWRPEQTMFQVPASEFREHVEFLGTSGHVDIFRDMKSGELLYVGRTQEGAPPAHLSGATVEERLASLAEELGRLGAFEDIPPGEYKGKLESCYERARQLVEDAGEGEPGPLQMQGIAARLLKRWDEAASLFSGLTVLRPNDIDGWLELTWALGMANRLDEAECAARAATDLSPDHPGALGNLAVVLVNQGKHSEARTAIVKALAADPDDENNKLLLAEINQAISHSQTWWRRLLSKLRNDPSAA